MMMSLKEIPEGALFWAAVEKMRVFFRHNKKGVELYTIITVQLYTGFAIQNFASTFEVCFQVFFLPDSCCISKTLYTNYHMGLVYSYHTFIYI